MHAVCFKGNLICFEETAMFLLSWKETYSGTFFAQQEPYAFSTFHYTRFGMSVKQACSFIF